MDIKIPYTPRKHQAHLHRKIDKHRWNVLVCHRRFGKTVFTINETIDKALRNERKNPQYAYFAPYYGQAKRVAWDYFKDFTKDFPDRVVNEAELRIDIPRPAQRDRIRFLLLGADNPTAIRGIYLDGAILDEFAEFDPTVWTQVIRPTLADRIGWAIFIGTPKGLNHFHDIFMHGATQPDWFTVVYKSSETGVIDPAELEGAKATMADDEFRQEFECSWSASFIGSYYGRLIEEAMSEGRICDVPYDPALTTATYWDLGIGDSTSIWYIQRNVSKFQAIDYTEMSGVGLDRYVKIVNSKRYNYSEHILPHDAAARELGTGRTRQELIVSMGLKHTFVQKRQTIDDRINAVRMVLPKMWFDAKKCAKGIQGLKHYQKKWDAKTKIFSDKPRHDWASHPADAFGHFALETGYERRDVSLLPRRAKMDYDIFG